MKNRTRKFTGILSLFFALYSFVLIPDCISQWVLTSGGLINSTYMGLAANTNTIFVIGMNGRVYLTTNDGANWTSSLDMSGSYGYSLAVNGSNIFAGYDGIGVFVSTNNGTNWTQTSLNNKTVNALAVNGNNIFAGTSGNYGVYLSTNNGVNWTQTSLNNRTVSKLAVKGDTIYAGTATYGVYISTDNGVNWTQTSLNNRGVISFAIYGNNIFAGTQTYGVYISTDNGANWTQTSLSSPSVNSLAINGNNVFAGTYGNGFYKSYDNGTSWTQSNDGLSGLFVRALCISNNFIFACPDSRVYRRPLGELTGTETVSNEIPNQFSLSQNYPNPFNPKTIINYQLPTNNYVTLKIYDLTGKEVAVLVNEIQNPGKYEVEFDGSSLTSGVYFCKLESVNYSATVKMILLK